MTKLSLLRHIGACWFFFLGTTFATSPLEIQCKTPVLELDFVLKRSPDTQLSYALLLSSDNLETYTSLEDDLIVLEDENNFKYLNQTENQIIELSLVTGEGQFSLGWHQFTQEMVNLSDCKSTVP